MQIADRLTKIPPYLFMELRKKIAKAKADGVDVISLAIGDPVEPTPDSIIDELCRTARDPENHRYPTDEEKGMFAFRQEVARWYKTRYGVTLDPATEILGLIGSKEGCHHFVMARINPGDVVLMTDPGYPAYRASILMGGGIPYNVPIRPENDYLPVFEEIPAEIVKKARGMFLNYPNNPTGACATREFFDRLVAFAKANDIAVCYDNPYSEIVFEGQERLSFLCADGAKEVGVELNSLSKPYNMTGWRIGMAVREPGAHRRDQQGEGKHRLRDLQRRPVRGDPGPSPRDRQHRPDARDLRAEAGEGPRDPGQKIGIDFNPPKGTFYLWVPTPKGMGSLEFTNRLFEKAAVVVAAGTAYGQYGEGFIRISLTVPDARLEEAMARIEKAFA